MKQPDLYYFKTIKMTSQAQSKFTENTHMWLVFSTQTLIKLVTSFLWLQNSTDEAVSWKNYFTQGHFSSSLNCQT